MSNFDRFETPYHQKWFSDAQDKEVIEYSTCTGCGEVVTMDDVAIGEILNIYGMCVHDDVSCIKKSVNAEIIILEGE
ncbi:hypothetical protein BSK50_14245 [Paenibacillus odorifer]|nr:hypothetical protein BSK50_14245 [Paenibacillus odorifer]